MPPQTPIEGEVEIPPNVWIEEDYEQIACKFSDGSENNGRAYETSLFSPKYMKVGSNDFNTYQPVVYMDSYDFKPMDTIHKINDTIGNQSVDLESRVDVLVNKFFPDNFMINVCSSSNNYIKERRKKEPELILWSNKISNPITLSEIYQLLSLIYYFGLVKLPSKRDYWNTHPLMSYHPICHALDMSRDRFFFIWRHFHLNQPIQNDFENKIGDNSDETDEPLEEIHLERVHRD